MSTKRPTPDFSGNSASRTAWEWIVIMLVAIVVVPIALGVLTLVLPFAIIGGLVYGGVRIYQSYSQRGW